MKMEGYNDWICTNASRGLLKLYGKKKKTIKGVSPNTVKRILLDLK